MEKTFVDVANKDLFDEYSSATGNTFKYSFVKDFSATGTNVIPTGSQEAQVQLKRDFKAGEIVEGVYSEGSGGTPMPSVLITVTTAKTATGADYSGTATFTIPAAYLQQVKTGAAIPKKGFDFLKPFTNVTTTKVISAGAVGIATLLYAHAQNFVGGKKWATVLVGTVAGLLAGTGIEQYIYPLMHKTETKKDTVAPEKPISVPSGIPHTLPAQLKK